MKRLRARALALAAGAALVMVPAQAHAVSFLGEKFLALGGSVTVRYIGSSAAYFNTMQWFRNGYGAVNYTGTVVDYSNSGTVDDLFYSQNGYKLDGTPVSGTAPGSTVVLGGGYSFGVGEEVLLGLFVHNEYDAGPGGANWKTQDADDFTYFSGPMSRNKDSRFHLLITDLGGGTFQFKGGWEDTENGGDEDYNDMEFEISGVTVTPEPVSMALMATGLAGMAGAALRRRRRPNRTLTPV